MGQTKEEQTAEVDNQQEVSGAWISTDDVTAVDLNKWQQENMSTAVGAFDVYMQVLDATSCVPNFETLSYLRWRWLEGQSVRCNGVTLNR